MEVVIGMPFLTLGNTNIQFAKKEPTWRTYTTEDALPTTWRIGFINKKKFVKAALDKNIEAFVVYVSFLSIRSKMTIYLARKAEIASLLAEKITVPAEYSDFAKIFSKKSAKVFSKCTGINKYTIELKDDKQPLYGPIYSLGPVELETLNTYIKTNLVNGFIRPLKSSAGALILFVCKPDGSLRLYVNYQGLKNLNIKNRFALPLIC